MLDPARPWDQSALGSAAQRIRLQPYPAPQSGTWWHDVSIVELIALGLVAVGVLLSASFAGVKLLALYNPLLPLTSAIHQLGGTLDIERDQAHDQQLRIDLNGRPVRDLSFLGSARYFPVAELDLSQTPIDDSQLEHLSRLLMVRTLNLGGTQISDAGLATLTRVQGLRELNLSGTQITKSGLATLVSCPNLAEVDLSATTVVPHDLKTLPAHAANLRIRTSSQRADSVGR